MGGKGDGREDADVLAGALRRPRGSLRFDLDNKSIEPSFQHLVSSRY